MDIIKRKLRGKQMLIEGLRSENALLKQSLFHKNRTTQNYSSNELQSNNSVGSSEVPPNHCVTELQGHGEVQRNLKTQGLHEKKIQQPLMKDKQCAIAQRQQPLMPSSSQAQKLPTQSPMRYTLQDQGPAADLEEIESFFHKIQHQLQSSQNEGSDTQLAVKSRQTQQSSNQIHAKEHIETNVEVTCVTSVRTVQTQMKTPNLQPRQVDQGNKPCQTAVPQKNFQRSLLPIQMYNTLTPNPQASQYSAQQSVQGLQSVNQVQSNSTQRHQLPQHSPQQHFVQGPQTHERLHKNPSENLQLPKNSPRLLPVQRHQNPQQFHNVLPQSLHSMQFSPQTHFQRPNNPQQIFNNASHNVHSPLQSPQSQIQRFHNPQQIQNANYNVQPSQQHLQRTHFGQQPFGISTHHFQPPQHSPQQSFQGSPNFMPPQHSPSVGTLPQQAKSIQEYPNSQQILQRQQLPPLQFVNQQSKCAAVQTNQPLLQRPNLPSETFHRPQQSPQNPDQRPNHARGMPPPLYQAPFLSQLNQQQLHVTLQHSQGVSSSRQQISLGQGYEKAHNDYLNQACRSKRAPDGSSTTKSKQQIAGQDRRIGNLNSIQNSLGHMYTSQTNTPDSPQQNKEPHITQAHASPSNPLEMDKNLSSPVMESTQKIVLGKQQNSDSLPSTSSVHSNSCTQNEGVSDTEKAIEVQTKISTAMGQEKEKSCMAETGKQNINYTEGPFLKIVKEEPLSELPDTSMGTSYRWSSIGKKISVEDSLGVSEFFHLEDITASVPVAKLSNRPEIISGPKKRSSVGESSLDRNTDIPPQSIITPPQTPPTPIPSSARGASPGLSINATQVMKALANQAYHHAMVDSDVTYCNVVQNNESNMPVSNSVSDETKPSSDRLRTLISTVLQRNKSRVSASFLSKSPATDASAGNSEAEDNISKTSEKGSRKLVERFSLENAKNDPQEISGHAAGFAFPSPDDGTGLTESHDNCRLAVHSCVHESKELQDQELIASNSGETDKKRKHSGCQEFSFAKHKTSQESRVLEEELTSLEQEITSPVSTTIECSEVCPSNSSAIDEPSGSSFGKEENTVDRFQRVTNKESITNSVDSGERSQQVEYLIESVKSETVEGVSDYSLLENSLSDLDVLVEYVDISDYPDECEMKFSQEFEDVDGETDWEVSHYESNVTEKGLTESYNASSYDNENKGNVLEIYLPIDAVTGKLTDPKKIPECCPLCYTEIGPSRITISAETFDMKTICLGCNLTILLIWGAETSAYIDENRPCPKSKKRKIE